MNYNIDWYKMYNYFGKNLRSFSGNNEIYNLKEEKKNVVNYQTITSFV